MKNLEDVTIRPFVEADAQAFFSLVDRSREHLSQWLPWIDAHESIVHSRRHISAGIVQQALQNGGQWGVFFHGELAGEVCLHWIQTTHRSTSLGYWIGAPYLGKGIATAACKQLLDYCFLDLKLNRVELSAALENEPSLKLAARLGFIEEGCHRQMVFHANRFWDHRMYGLLREEFLGAGYRGNRISPASQASL